MKFEDFQEKNVEDALIKRVTGKGGLCLKIMLAGMTGFPDRACLMPGGKIVFVELKKPDGKLSKRQELWHANLRSLGFRVEVLWDFLQVCEFCHTL